MTAQAARNDSVRLPNTPQAVPEVVHGRAILANGLEFACLASNVTTKSADIRAQGRVEAGASLVLYLDGLGLVQGRVTTTTHQGFTVELFLIEAMSKRFAARLDWQTGNASRRAELHRAPRIVPLHKSVEVRLGEQIVFPGTILNISMSGAAIFLGANPLPFLRARVRVGMRDATVVRLIERGIAVEFVEPFTASNFNDCVRL